ncbi:MAG: ATP-binding protein, partial [Rhodospirillales bacterium]|nr:ATP-binding protein [Rhodospirillales bacterium]
MGHDDNTIHIGRDAFGNVMIAGNGNVLVIQAGHSIDLAAAPTGRGDFGPNPYVGLAAFTEAEAEHFFGREEKVAELHATLWEMVKASADRADAPPRLLPILGPSGSGKSSLARAGLLPELARRPLPGMLAPRVVVLNPGAHPLEALAVVLARIATDDAAPVAKAREFAEEMRRLSAE